MKKILLFVGAIVFLSACEHETLIVNNPTEDSCKDTNFAFTQIFNHY